MNDRLDKLLMAEQLSPAKFADIIGVQRSSISHIISGRNKPSFDFIAKVLQRFPRINADWLILGKGEMYKQMVQASLFDAPPVAITPAVNEDLAGAAFSTVGSSHSADIDPIEEPMPASVTSKTQVSQNSESPEMQLIDKDVERIVIFYTDRTFRTYTPAKE